MAGRKFEGLNNSQMVETTLDLLHYMDEDNNLSQRGLSKRLGVALGLTNALLKRCIKKGLLKVRNAPANRYVYYVTPKGLSEKSRLTAEYLSHSLKFFRRVRAEYREIFLFCKMRGWERVALCGCSELAEIALLAARESEVPVAGIVDFERNEEMVFDLPVLRSLDDIASLDALILTCAVPEGSSLERAVLALDENRIVAPAILRMSTSLRVETAEADKS